MPTLEADRQKTLGDICSKTFLYLSTFRQEASTAPVSAAEAEAALQRVWREEKVASEATTELLQLYEKARYLLVVCADEFMRQADWDDAPRWRSQEDLAFGTTVGGERFFELIDDPSYADPQLREIFYQCLALGFEGAHVGETSYLRDLRRTLRLGIEDLPRDRADFLSPEAYEHTQGEDFTTMPVASTVKLLIVLLGVVLALAVFARALYGTSVKELSESARTIADDIKKAG